MKNNIEEDIKTVNKYINFNEICGTRNFKQAIENILADRERLEKDNKKLKKQDEKDYTLVYMKGYEDCRQKFEAKANKYDALAEKAKRLLDYAENYAEKGEFNNGYCQAINNVLKEEV